jgi:hypothetical protein
MTAFLTPQDVRTDLDARHPVTRAGRGRRTSSLEITRRVLRRERLTDTAGERF